MDNKFVFAHGRRKEAVARVRLSKGKGQTLINDKPVQEFLVTKVAIAKFNKPFQITKSEDKFYASIKVSGSGTNSQLDAIIHGLARTLSQANPTYKSIIRRAGLLTRDPRVKERRKYGRAQKARKGKQSPKR